MQLTDDIGVHDCAGLRTKTGNLATRNSRCNTAFVNWPGGPAIAPHCIPGQLAGTSGANCRQPETAATSWVWSAESTRLDGIINPSSRIDVGCPSHGR